MRVDLQVVYLVLKVPWTLQLQLFLKWTGDMRRGRCSCEEWRAGANSPLTTFLLVMKCANVNDD